MQLSDILRIVQNAGLELNESVTNLIFCVFASYFPEIYRQINQEEKRKEEEKREKEEHKDDAPKAIKFEVSMTPIKDSMG